MLLAYRTCRLYININQSKMKKLILLAFVLFTTKNYSQISSNNTKNHISLVVAPFSDNENGTFSSFTQYSSDFYILDFDSSDASLNLPFNKKSKYNKSDQNFELELTRVAKKYSGKMVASLYLKDGAFDFESLYSKGLDQLTEDQRANYSANFVGLKNSAESQLIFPMIDSNYLFIVSPAKDGSIVWSVFRVFIADGNNTRERDAAFLDIYGENPEKIAESEFPVELLGYGKLKKEGILSALTSGTISEFDKVIMNAQKNIFQLRKKSLILDGLKIALGSIDGLKVDDLIISYRLIEDEETEEFEMQKMGVDRVKKVGNNDIDLIQNPNAKAERSQLYADGGRVSRQGYIALEKKEVAMGLSAGINISETSTIPYLKVDYRIGRYIGVPNLFFIAEAEFMGGVNIDGFGADAATLVNVGLQKTINLGRKFNTSIYGLYSVYSAAGSAASGGEVTELDIQQIKAGVSFAIKFGNLQIMPHITYALDDPDTITNFSSIDSNFYGSSIIVGAGLRYNF